MLKTLMIGLTPPLEGGSERHIFEVASRMDNVVVLTQKGSLCKDKIEIYVSKMRGYMQSLTFFLSVFFNLPRIFLSKFDTVHIHENYLFLLLPLFKIKFNTVVTIHGISGFRFYENKLIWSIFRKVLKFSDKIIVVSLPEKHILEEEFKNTYYITNGVDNSVYDDIRVDVEKKITFVGRIHEQKGILYLLEAFYKIKDKRPEFRLELIGEINDEAKEFMRKFPDKRIIWRGFILDRKELFREIKSSYVLVYPSLWEALPWPALLEGLGSGRPAIASDLKGMNEIFLNKENILLVESKNSDDIYEKLLKVIEDEKFANFIGSNGKKEAKKYDWGNIVIKVNEVLSKW
ncbi:MAG: glycosyltransferase family 4 protein [Nanoarchaeota archaeon]